MRTRAAGGTMPSQRCNRWARSEAGDPRIRVYQWNAPTPPVPALNTMTRNSSSLTPRRPRARVPIRIVSGEAGPRNDLPVSAALGERLHEAVLDLAAIANGE